MQKERIVYKGKVYQGYVHASTEQQPHFYWFLFQDLELVRIYGDGITFRREDSELVCNRIYCGDDEFVAAVKHIVEGYATAR